MTQVPEQQDTQGGRVVLWAQWGLLTAYLVGSFGTLLAAVVQAGDLGALLDPRLERLDDPKVALPDSVWNPLSWVFGICRLVAMLVFPVALVGLISGVAAVAHAQRVGDRKVLLGSLAAIAAWVVLLAVTLSPYGRQLHNWLLD
ncbi:hypothetical protein ACFQFC_12985 [Amorphoplanes digitatis]|uniref:Uncharacterized protein n=1 Tax=Actinoplanes digitatis TaxID=1868 RepID=A0A7W7I277_9ACTN|nr:hypothetical protein [Actinoplanes digitatis]MBB4765118.1 hypothetical protein [Actinoplanes digitatis]GID98569.1 hypothetical protein Adi01nite_79810 [Actinoplanes digitatis]